MEEKEEDDGLVTVRKNDKVVLKIVAGNKGFMSYSVAQAIQAYVRASGKIPSLEQAYEIVSRFGFGLGNPPDLCLMDEKSFKCLGGELTTLYRSKFNCPRFNPRNKEGTARYVEVVDI